MDSENRSGNEKEEPKIEHQEKKETAEPEVELILTQSKFPELSKQTKAELLEECKMWRNIWGWIPSEVKYYASRTGQLCGIQIRNYHRYLGVLLETKWELKEMEIGTQEKIYDQNTGAYFFERKIVRLPVGQIVSWDWIKEREEVAAEEGVSIPEPEPEVIQFNEQT